MNARHPATFSTAPANAASAAALKRIGQQDRSRLPLSAHGDFVQTDRDPMLLLARQDTTRLPDLVPLRYQRMSEAPFRFYRGTAGLMAYDLEQQPSTGVDVIACGDAHVSNFGFYASPARTIVFDMNDFDEAAPAPWEWDVKRLTTSVVVGGQQLGIPAEELTQIAQNTVASYRRSINELATMSILDRYYLAVDAQEAADSLEKPNRKMVQKATKKAKRRTSEQVVAKMMEKDSNGRLRFIEDPPVLTHLDSSLEQHVEPLFEQYRATTRPDISLLLSSCTILDAARRVVGVGSVGTRCYVLALAGPAGAPLVLQIKEAQQSVLSLHKPHSVLPTTSLLPADASEGHRVVAYQQVLQSFSDRFLGHLKFNGRDFYVRQFRDMKGSLDVERMTSKQFDRYALACAKILARGHSQSPALPWIAGYLGETDEFDRAVAAWSFAYAAQAGRDYDALRQQLGSGAQE